LEIETHGNFMDTATTPKPASLYGLLTLPLRVAGSLYVTVFLFALSMILVFFGTVAQMNNGIWTVVSQYFWSYTVDIPFDLVATAARPHAAGVVPVPGREDHRRLNVSELARRTHQAIPRSRPHHAQAAG
jgi:hypothetical protein